ncbi:MAG: DUF1294 domain-containing protein [Bacteroidales bacterium]|nr:DUF1294 domain-containing protein [Bacteroidales bacterium]
MKFKHLLIIFLIVNLACFAVAGLDKRLAQTGNYNSPEDNNRRIAEVSLVTYSSFGGAIGTLAGFYIFNHKISEKKQYLRTNIYLLILENIFLYFLIFKAFKKRNE